MIMKVPFLGPNVSVRRAREGGYVTMMHYRDGLTV